MRKIWVVTGLALILYSCSDSGKNKTEETILLKEGGFSDSLVSRLSWNGTSSTEGVSISNSYFRIQEFSSGKQGLLKITETMQAGKSKPVKQLNLKAYAMLDQKMELLSELKATATEWEFFRSVLQCQLAGKDTEEDAIDLYNLENGNHLLHCSYSYLKVLYSNSKKQQFWGFESKASAGKSKAFENPLTAGVLDFGSTEQHLGTWQLQFKNEKSAADFPVYSPEFYFESDNSNLTRTDENRGIIVSGSDGKSESHPVYLLVMVFYDNKGNANTCKIPVENGKPDFEKAQYNRSLFSWSESEL